MNAPVLLRAHARPQGAATTSEARGEPLDTRRFSARFQTTQSAPHRSRCPHSSAHTCTTRLGRPLPPQRAAHAQIRRPTLCARRAASRTPCPPATTMATPLSGRTSGAAAAPAGRAPVTPPAAAKQAPPRPPLALLSLSAGALLAACPAGFDAAVAAEMPAPMVPPAGRTRTSPTTTMLFPSRAAPQVRATDDGLLPRSASGPAVNLDDPDQYWDALEGGAAPPPASAPYRAVKYVEASAAPAFGELADLNADVREAASDYRDPAIATLQDKGSDALSGSSSPDIGAAAESAKSNLDRAGADAKAKAKSVLSGSSALPRGAVFGELADLNADVREAASDYRDPAIATLQDKGSDALSGSSSPDIGAAAESAKSNLDRAGADAKAKAKSVLSGSSVLPRGAVFGELADLNADVREAASDYRDPAIATLQDKGSDALSGSSSPDIGAAAESAKSNLDRAGADAKAKAKSVLSGSSALPRGAAFGELADLNADVREAASDYRDPAIAALQDKGSDALSGSSSPDIGAAAESAKSNLDRAGADAKAKAKSVLSGSSALPRGAVFGELADLNADVREAASDYRDPAIAALQDKGSDALSGSSSPDIGAAAESAKSNLDRAGADAKAKAKSVLSGSSALPRGAVFGKLADLNADVREAASDYRDPAIAALQDKGSDALSGSSSPDIGAAAESAKSNLDRAGADAKAKAKSVLSGSSALPRGAVFGELADLNADVREAASDYRDPAIAALQDKGSDALSGSSSPDIGAAAESAKSNLDRAGADAKAKAKSVLSGSSVLPRGAVFGELADLNADVREAASDYRDPAIATLQDKGSDALSGSSSPDIGAAAESAKSNLDRAGADAKAKAKSVLSGSSALPRGAVFGELADLNADVREAASDYRDPAIAALQDKGSDALSGSSSPDIGAAAESAKSNLDRAGADAKAKAKSVLSGSSVLPRGAVFGELADLNADVREAASDYRDPAIATLQDKGSDALSGSSSPDIGAAAESAKSNLDRAGADAKAKAKSVLSGSSALPRGAAFGELADLNADVREAASDYRDPAIAALQDKGSDALSGSSSPDIGAAAESAKSNLDRAGADAKAKAKSVLSGSSALPRGAVFGELADLNADVREAASDYRDPAIAALQDKGSDALSGSSSPDIGAAAESAKSNLDRAGADAKAKAKSVLSGSSALPRGAVFGKLADLNADVREAASDYRDPAIAALQDKGSDALSGSSSPDIGAAAESAKSNLDRAGADAKAKAKSVLSGSSALPRGAVFGKLADLNADVREAASDYRDPAIAALQDKGSDALSGSSSPDIGAAAESAKSNLDRAGADAKAKAKSVLSGSSALPRGAVFGELADLNADVREAASDYRDPAIAALQDKGSDALSGSSSPDIGAAAESAKSNLDRAGADAKAKAKSVLSGSSALPRGAVFGELADLNADVRDESAEYRDPAAAVQQDTAAGAASRVTKSLPTGAYDSLATKSAKRVAKKPVQAVRKAASAASSSESKGPGNARLSKPLVRDSLGLLRPASTNQTGAAGGGDRGGKKALKTAVKKASEVLSSSS